ncbi:Blp family class II bacteriocin [Streptococcus dentasini]
MTTKAFEQFDVMDTQALAAVEGGSYWDDLSDLAAIMGDIGYIAANVAARREAREVGVIISGIV